MNLVTFNIIFKCKACESDEEVIFEKSKDNKNIFRICLNGNNIYLGNKESVKDDVNDFIKTLNISNIESDFIILGLGTGEHILELIKKINSEARILIVEPNIQIIKEFMKLSYSKDIIENDNIILYLYSKDDILDIMDQFLNSNNIANTKCGVFANYGEVYPEIFTEIYSSFITVQKSIIMDLGTHVVHSYHFFKSFIYNFKFIIESPRVNCIKNIYEGMPAVVVSAGPSLLKNVHMLKEYQDQFIIITGGRTLKVLLDLGITPDFVCVIDPDTPAFDVMKDSLDSEVPLVYSEFTNYEVIRSYKGKKVFFTDVGMKDSIRNLFEEDIDGIYEGGSVAHVCAGLAVYLGCSSVVFIGQDFAYTDDKNHFNQEHINYKTKNYFYVDDVYGKKVKIDDTLNLYKIAMEKFIEMNKKVTFINSTAGGANIQGTKIMNLTDALSSLKRKAKDKNKIKQILNESNNKLDKGKIINKMKLIAKNIEIIRELCVSALNSYNDYIEFKKDGYDDIESIANNFNITNSMIFSSIEELEIIDIMISPALINIVSNPLFKEKEGMSIEEKNEVTIKQNTILYSNIIKASNELLFYLKNMEN